MAGRNYDRLTLIARAVMIVAVIVVVCFAIELVLGWYNDYASCTRSNDVRRELQRVALYFDGARDRANERASHDPPALARLDRESALAANAASGAFQIRFLACDAIVPGL